MKDGGSHFIYPTLEALHLDLEDTIAIGAASARSVRSAYIAEQYQVNIVCRLLGRDKFIEISL